MPAGPARRASLIIVAVNLHSPSAAGGWGGPAGSQAGAPGTGPAPRTGVHPSLHTARSATVKGDEQGGAADEAKRDHGRHFN
jgi:hypothetical protein